jgi:molybdenum cofactor cytidylyltransferase
MSTRMGSPKQLLPLGGRPAIEWIVDVLVERLDQVIVVLGHRAEEVGAAIADRSVTLAMNEDYRQGMLSSVQCGLRVAVDADHLICLGDQPQLAGTVVDQVLQAAATADSGMVIPTYAGNRGHPIYLRCKYRQEVLSLALDGGLNRLMQRHPGDVQEVAVGEDGILEDMDTPADYRHQLNKWKQ